MRTLRTIVLWCLLISFCTSLFGCHTIHGAGEDIEAAGRAIEDAVR
jgi:predicted small secreted protein